jgi:hypothetical protein
MKNRKFLPLPGLELRPIDCTACSRYLYRLRYLSSLRIDFILLRLRVTVNEFWIDSVIGILPFVTTSRDFAPSVVHTSQITIEHARSSQSQFSLAVAW